MPLGHSETILTVGFSPDEKYILSAGAGNVIYVWQAETGKLLQVLKGHPSGNIHAFFNQTGNYVVSASADGENNCFVWHTQSGRIVTRFTIENYTNLSFVQDNLLLINRSDSTILFDLEAEKIIVAEVKTADHKIFVRKDEFIRIAENNKTLFLETVTIEKKMIVTRIPLPVATPVFNAGISKWSDNLEVFQFSKTGTYLSYRSDDSIFIFNTASGNVMYKDVHEGGKEGLVFFSGNDELLIWMKGYRVFNQGNPDSIAVLNLVNKDVKMYEANNLNSLSMLYDSCIFSLHKVRITYADKGTTNESRISGINVYSGKQKLMVKLEKDVKEFSVTANYILCNVNATGSSLRNDIQTYLIKRATGAIENIYNGQLRTNTVNISNFAHQRKLLLINNSDYSLQYYKVPQGKLVVNIKTKSNVPGMLSFVDTGKALFTGNRFLEINTIKADEYLPEKFSRYNEKQNYITQYSTPDSGSVMYDLANRKALLKIKGKPVDDQQAGDWTYLLTQYKDTVFAAAVLSPFRFKAKGYYQATDPDRKYLITAFNPFKEDNETGFEKKEPITDTPDSKTFIWDMATGKQVQIINGAYIDYELDIMNKQIEYVVATDHENGYHTLIYHTKTKKTRKVTGQYEFISVDKKYLFTKINYDYYQYLLPSGELIDSFSRLPPSFKYGDEQPESFPDSLFIFKIMSKDSNYYFTYYKDSTLVISSVKDKYRSAPLKIQIPVPGNIIIKQSRYKQIFTISDDRKKLFYTHLDNRSYDLEDNTYVELDIDLGEEVKQSHYTDNAHYLVTVSETFYDFLVYTYSVWDLKTGKRIMRYENNSLKQKPLFSVSEKKQLGSYYADGNIRFIKLNTGNELFSFIDFDSSNYLFKIPSGYYFSTPSASKLLHYVTTDFKVVTFEQLDVKYNRPDKVLEAIGSTDTALIKSYRKAYEKRIKKLGIDTTAFRADYSVPAADFANRDNIEFEQKDSKLKLDIKSDDSTYKLDRFNVWVNEAPVYGQRGLSLRNKNKNNFDSTITINLSQGENKIETSITNVNGTESYRMPLQINYTPAVKQTEKTYFIGIGIDQFADSKYNLKYSTKDIRDLSKKLKEKYKDIIIDTLFNENVTISNVKALKQKLLQTTVNDKVIISYSGHGMLSKDFDYYLSTYAVNFEKPEENGLPYDELESLLDSIPARKKLMLIDACHSGEVDKDDLIALDATDKKLIKGLKPVAYKIGGHLGLKNSFELMQSLFVNVGKSTGATIISAAAGTEFALEGIDNLPNGVFTYSILEAMNKYPSMKISELKKIVGERVVQLTNGLQKPTSRNETIAVDWKVWGD